eukprot:TRINITY_DN5251_c0_g1_i4.p2 TRINITY_DN5251_c0_g1~~TRINITY_DN5251_c0_g1_i4.p2  ORF type:complete len:223 (+),score=-6.86 TRINITY_DN5251_c0_g1_i4:655-1323(+)
MAFLGHIQIFNTYFTMQIVRNNKQTNKQIIINNLVKTASVNQLRSQYSQTLEIIVYNIKRNFYVDFHNNLDHFNLVKLQQLKALGNAKINFKRRFHLDTSQQISNHSKNNPKITRTLNTFLLFVLIENKNYIISRQLLPSFNLASIKQLRKQHLIPVSEQMLCVQQNLFRYQIVASGSFNNQHTLQTQILREIYVASTQLPIITHIRRKFYVKSTQLPHNFH